MDDRKKTTTTVYIAGQPYSLTSSQTEERIHRVALYVDQQITKLRGSLRYNERMVTVLAALNLADELFTEREKTATLREELEKMRQPRVVYLPTENEASPAPPPEEAAAAEKPEGVYARRLSEKQKQNG
ncbi:MAG: cell division protein ZapA [Christensenellales bacterium]|jgi:cell division protein ZapA (FtsZ GTPase activity inhibitor)